MVDRASRPSNSNNCQCFMFSGVLLKDTTTCARNQTTNPMINERAVLPHEPQPSHFFNLFSAPAIVWCPWNCICTWRKCIMFIPDLCCEDVCRLVPPGAPQWKLKHRGKQKIKRLWVLIKWANDLLMSNILSPIHHLPRLCTHMGFKY